MLKKDQPLNMPFEDPDELFDELELDDHEDDPDLFEVEDEVFMPWEAEFLFELILMPTEKTTQLALLAETQAHMGYKLAKDVIEILLVDVLNVDIQLICSSLEQAGFINKFTKAKRCFLVKD